GDTATDAAYKEYFDEQCGRIDVTGRHRFRKLVEMAFRGMLRDGDSGFALVKKGGEIKLQSIEADRIGKPNEPTNSERYIGGLTLNEWGAIESFRIYDRSRTSQYVNPREVKPANFIHLVDPIRSDQYRGISFLQSALPHARHLYEWFKMEWQAGKYAASYAGFFSSKDPHASKGSSAWNGKTPEGTPTMDAIMGKLVKLGEGESVTFAPGTNRPTGSFMAFVQATVREIALGLDLPFGFIYNLAELGGVTARIEVMQTQRAINYWRELLMDLVLNRVKDAVLAAGIAAGKIPAVPFWKRGKWSFGAALTGDVGHQTGADMQLVGMGLKCGGDVTNELFGEEFKDTARKAANEVVILQQLASELGIPIEMIAPQRFPQATSMLAAMNTPPAPPPPGIIGEIGDSGAKQ
ncbi:MAG: phage portal protein, partial [Verrucomicrobiota bacterium]